MWFLFLAGVGTIAYFALRPLPVSASYRVSDVVKDSVGLFWAELKTFVSQSMGGSAPVLIQSLAEAIKKFEGWSEGTRSFRNNNPGNLKYTDWTKGQGAMARDDKGFAVFPDYATGWKALVNLLLMRVRQHPDWSILELFNSYAPPTENDTRQYASFVAKAIGGDVETKIGALV